MLASTAMIAITTRSSINVKAGPPAQWSSAGAIPAILRWRAALPEPAGFFFRPDRIPCNFWSLRIFFSDRASTLRVMSKKSILLASVLVLLVGLSLYFNKDRFRSDSVQIGHRSVPTRGRRAPNAPAESLTFLLDRQLKLTALKVISADELATNKYAHPVWDLVSDSNSVPVKTFVYGANIRGM